jgi:hypothetical protein
MPALTISTIPQPPRYEVRPPGFFARHDGKKVLEASELTTAINTGSNLIAFTTQAEVDAKITELNLTPLPEGVTQIIRPITIPAGEFILRFTKEQYAAARASDNLDIQQFLAVINTGLPINLKDPRTIDGVQLCAGVGIIQQSDIDKILV